MMGNINANQDKTCQYFMHYLVIYELHMIKSVAVVPLSAFLLRLFTAESHHITIQLRDM